MVCSGSDRVRGCSPIVHWTQANSDLCGYMRSSWKGEITSNVSSSCSRSFAWLMVDSRRTLSIIINLWSYASYCAFGKKTQKMQGGFLLQTGVHCKEFRVRIMLWMFLQNMRHTSEGQNAYCLQKKTEERLQLILDNYALSGQALTVCVCVFSRVSRWCDDWCVQQVQLSVVSCDADSVLGVPRLWTKPRGAGQHNRCVSEQSV